MDVQHLPPGWRIKVLPVTEHERHPRLFIQAASGKSALLFTNGEVTSAVFAELGEQLDAGDESGAGPDQA